MRDVTIHAVLNGWVVQVGCQTVVYGDRGQLVTDLDQYLRDPPAMEERFLKTAVNAAFTGGPTPAMPGNAVGGAMTTGNAADLPEGRAGSGLGQQLADRAIAEIRRR